VQEVTHGNSDISAAKEEPGVEDAVGELVDAEHAAKKEPWAIRRASSTGSVRSSSDLELKVRSIIQNSQPDVT
jgi:hypothetical protein